VFLACLHGHLVSIFDRGISACIKYLKSAGWPSMKGYVRAWTQHLSPCTPDSSHNYEGSVITIKSSNNDGIIDVISDKISLFADKITDRIIYLIKIIKNIKKYYISYFIGNVNYHYLQMNWITRRNISFPVFLKILSVNLKVL